ncbi:MAG: lysozyme inhibitor LprI family protein [Holophagaceae bacterium]
MNLSFRSLLVLALVTVCGGLQAQTKAAKQIEKRLAQELRSSEGSTTMGMVAAYEKAAKSYAVEIGRIYHKLESVLPKNQREVLVEGQRAWQEYLKAQRLFVSYVYDADGTVHKPMAMCFLKDTLQHRLDELCAFFMRQQDEFDEKVPTGGDWCAEIHEKLEGEDALAAASQAVKPLAVKSKVP